MIIIVNRKLNSRKLAAVLKLFRKPVVFGFIMQVFVLTEKKGISIICL